MTDTPAAGGNDVEKQPIVQPEWLVEHLDDPSVVVAEVEIEKDRPDYTSGHIPGAQGWYWKDVAWDDLERQFPQPDVMARRLAERGVGDDTTLVVYGERNQFATYVYWIATELCGLSNVHVLDGGKKGWRALGQPLTTDETVGTPVERTIPDWPRNDRSRIHRETLLAALGETPPRLLDARVEEEYDGRRVKAGTGLDHGATRHGHIPGARNLVYERFMDPETGRFRSREELAGLFAEFEATPQQTDDVVAYCRLGHRASMVWFVATQLLGYDHLRVYDGSWTEWGSLVGVPVEK